MGLDSSVGKAPCINTPYHGKREKIKRYSLGSETKTPNTLLGEVVPSALPAKLRTDDTQAYLRMDCKRGNPVSALGVGGNSLWKK